MEFNYQRTRKHTIGKLVVMCLAMLLPLVLIGVFGSIYNFIKGDQALDLKIFRYVVCIIFEAIIILKIVLYARIISSEEWARKYFVKKRDERNMYIKQRTSGFTMKFLLFFEAIGMIVSGFISQQVFYCLGGVIVTTLLAYIFTYLYFSKKI